MVTIGVTDTVAMVVEEQLPVVPVILYVVVTVGLATTTLLVVELKPVAGVHEYVVAPLAVKVAEVPAQTVALFTVTVGVGLTVTWLVSAPVHPLDVPVTVYVIVAVGLATTVVAVVELNPVAGVQL
jgi:hypothetical protein